MYYQKFSRLFIVMLFQLVIISACSKEKGGKVDVSSQWKVNRTGEIISSPNDEQWSAMTFTAEEMSLFSSLDTTNLTGTSMPVNVKSAKSYPYPNPFVNYNSIGFDLSDEFNGEVVLKFVIINRSFDVIEKKAIRLQSRVSNVGANLTGNIPVGKYRLYCTLSSESNPHFYKSWGNIEKIQ